MANFQIPSSFSVPLNYDIQLDGQTYSFDVFYLFFGQRFYFTITDQSGNVVVTRPLISSNGDINNLFGYFTTKLFYSEQDQLAVTV